MSQQSQSVQPQAQPSAALSPEIINALTEKLGEFVTALQALNQNKTSETAPEEAPDKIKEPDQIRCYRVPGFMVLEEQEILNGYQAEDVVDLIRKARDDFSITSLFMRRFNDDYSLDGFTVQHIGEILSKPLVMLNKACSILADYEPQETESNCEC